jgi:protein-S-isoprenylcysteine O-methyltransferase Ste14
VRLADPATIANMPADVHQYVSALWIVVAIIFLIGALTAKRAARRQSVGSRALHLGMATLAYFLLFSRNFRPGFLGWRFVPADPLYAWLGLSLTAAGLGFTLWARFYLGRNWSATVTVKQDHQLIRGGPYAIVRHPLYSGLLLAFLGTSIAFRDVRGLVATLLLLAAWRMKLRLEESFMTEQFGDQYAQYKREVKGLIPFVW